MAYTGVRKVLDRSTTTDILKAVVGPRGRFVLIGTIASGQGSDLDFWDLDFEGEKPENEKDLTANLQLVASGDHYGVTEVKVIAYLVLPNILTPRQVDWDPTGSPFMAY